MAITFVKKAKKTGHKSADLLKNAIKIKPGTFVRLPGGIILGEVPLSKLSMRQVRFRRMDGLQLDALKESVTRLGVKDPVLVIPEKDGTFGLVDGHHRYDELKAQGYTSVPVIILTDRTGKTLSKAEADLAMHRFNISAHEDGENYLKVLRDLSESGIAAKDIALATAKDEATINELLRSFEAAYGGGGGQAEGDVHGGGAYGDASPFGDAAEDVPTHESSRGSPIMVALPNTKETVDLIDSVCELFGAETPGDGVIQAMRTIVSGSHNTYDEEE